MATEKNWEVEVEKINSEVQLCKQKLDIIETNFISLTRSNWVIGRLPTVIIIELLILANTCEV